MACTRLSKPNLNILLLGRTGVGKSTFINCFANYLKFSNLDEIRSKVDVDVPIPCIFELPDDNQEPRLFKLGSENNQDGNESLDPLKSQTQGCKAYGFEFGDLTVTLIDTPGIVDTEGVEKDEQNLKNIIEFLTGFETINAICILLKPDETRLDVILRYWVLQILNQFDRSAVDNLVFAFTHSRKTRYGPGPTVRAMKEVFQQIRGYHPDLEGLCLNQANCYYFDSESFHFMVAKEEIEFSGIEKLLYTDSWNKARAECFRLINHVRSLISYDVKETWSICRARQLIENLNPLMQKIAKAILENEERIQEKQREVEEFEGSVEDLRVRMFILRKVIEVIHYDCPRWVCNSNNCVEEVEVDGVVNKIPKVCYKAEGTLWETAREFSEATARAAAGIMINPNHLNSVVRSRFVPVVASGVAITSLACLGFWYTMGTCSTCKCVNSCHALTYYEMKENDIRVLDAGIKTEYDTTLNLQSEKQNCISNLEEQRKKLNKDWDPIHQANSIFAVFLKHRALVPYNDAYEAYLEYLIKQEKANVNGINMAKIERLEMYKLSYKLQKDSIEEGKLRDARGIELANWRCLDLGYIETVVQGLYQLQPYGTMIQTLVEDQKRFEELNSKLNRKSWVNRTYTTLTERFDDVFSLVNSG